jgi:hypothetical protein
MLVLDIIEITYPNNKEMLMSIPIPILCPNCGQADKVQLASSAHIAPPLLPSDTVVKIVKIIRGIFGIFYGLAAIMLLVFVFGGMALGGFTALLGSRYDSTGMTSSIFGLSLIPMLCGGFLIILVLALMGAFMLGLPWLINRYAKQNYQQKLDGWQRAMNKYSAMFYCSRCAGVFLPEQNRIIPLEQMQAFLYEMQVTPLSYPLG